MFVVRIFGLTALMSLYCVVSACKKNEASTQKDVKQRPAAVTAILEAKPRNLEAALSALAKATPDWDRIVMSASKSLQVGNRLIISSEALATNVGILLTPGGDGFASLEMKIFDRESAEWQFIEMTFEEDLKQSSASDKKRIKTSDFVSGMAMHDNVFDHGEAKCNECHRGGHSRMDVREMHVGIGPGALADQVASIGRTRFDIFTTSSSTDALTRSNVKEIWLDTSKKIATRLARFDAARLARRLTTALQNDPRTAAGVMRILKGCSYDMQFDLPTAKNAFAFFKNDAFLKRRYFSLPPESHVSEIKSIADMQKFSRHFAEQLKLLRNTELARRIKDANANGLPNIPEESEELKALLPRLALYLDPIMSNKNPNLAARFWGMTAEHTGPWLNPGDERIYLETVSKAMQKILQKSEAPSCSDLTKIVNPS